MSEIIVYHGGTEIVEHPIRKLGRKNLDFGQGFYVTDIRIQASEWAKQVARRRGVTPILNRYLLKKTFVLEEFNTKIFTAYDKEWLDFIVASRSGLTVADQYDYIEGGIANDRVIDTINLYMVGLIDEGIALRRLSEHQPNNQICILSQTLIDKYLVFDGTEQL